MVKMLVTGRLEKNIVKIRKYYSLLGTRMVKKIWLYWCTLDINIKVVL